jgi:hypothetical protein
LEVRPWRSPPIATYPQQNRLETAGTG